MQPSPKELNPVWRFAGCVMLLAIAVWSTVLSGSACAADRPNILFLYTDDHSYRTVGAYPQSYPWVRTPTSVYPRMIGSSRAIVSISAWLM